MRSDAVATPHAGNYSRASNVIGTAILSHLNLRFLLMHLSVNNRTDVLSPCNLKMQLRWSANCRAHQQHFVVTTSASCQVLPTATDVPSHTSSNAFLPIKSPKSTFHLSAHLSRCNILQATSRQILCSNYEITRIFPSVCTSMWRAIPLNPGELLMLGSYVPSVFSKASLPQELPLY